MVLGPEYGAITSVALGLDRHSGKAVREGLSALTVGFVLAIVAAFAFALLVRVLGLEPTAFRIGIRPVTNLIDTPNLYSLVVAVLAGVVGIVSLTHARSSTLLGGFTAPVAAQHRRPDCGRPADAEVRAPAVATYQRPSHRE